MPQAKSDKRLEPTHVKRVGAFVRARREELGLSQRDVARALGYRSVMSVSGIEVGKESLALARAYAWADVLELRRDAFFLFVSGERANPPEAPTEEALLDDEVELISSYRKLPKPYQCQLREIARAFDALAREEGRKR